MANDLEGDFNHRAAQSHLCLQALEGRRREPPLPYIAPCSGRLDSDTQPFRSLAHTLVETQKAETNDRRTRNEKRCKVDGI